MIHDFIVIGAGTAGLQCARRLTSAGAQVVILDRADKPGGRCATRLMNGLPVDYGPLFIHGADPDFLSAIGGVGEGHWIEGWPRIIEGRGTPCQPEAFSPLQRRGTFAEGINCFPRALASGLAVKLGTQVTSLSVGKGTLTAESADGETASARGLVIAMALEQSAELLRTLPASRERDGPLALLEQFTSLPCITVIASYPSGLPAPRWDVCYPEDSPAILLIGNRVNAA